MEDDSEESQTQNDSNEEQDNMFTEKGSFKEMMEMYDTRYFKLCLKINFEQETYPDDSEKTYFIER